MVQEQGKYTYKLDWLDPFEKFMDGIEKHVKNCIERDLILTLPVSIDSENDFVFKLTMVHQMIDCKNCTAQCCKTGESIVLSPNDVVELVKLGKINSIRYPEKGEPYLEPPCEMLKDDLCSIYEKRPIICRLYPYQMGGGFNDVNSAISLDSKCPEAVRITKLFYENSWKLLHCLIDNHKIKVR